MNIKEHIPEQFAGKQLDCFKAVNLSKQHDADQLFKLAKHKLLDVNHWHQITAPPSAEFHIVDANNQNIDRAVQIGDHIRIDIPGPGLPSAKGYDWVQVEDIIEESTIEQRRIVLTLRPCADPTNTNDDIAHFFQKIATSSIHILQKQKHVFLHYAGRNEVINTKNESLADNFRNFLVGLGAKMGASFPQWRALIEGLGRLNYR